MRDEAAEPAAPEDATAAPGSPPVRRFCGACGQELVAADAACPRCAAHRRRPPLPDWDRPLRKALLLYFALLAVCLALLVCPADNARVQLAADAVFAVTVLLFTAGSWRELRPLLCRRLPLATLTLAPLVGMLTFGLAFSVIRFVLVPAGLEELRATAPFLAAGHSVPTMLLSLAVMPAVFEEIAFRGVIFGRMLAVMDARSAVIVTSMLFSVLHLNPASFVHLLVAGLAFGCLRLGSGSLWPGILAHFTHNAMYVAGELGGL